jgi:hypothetical protein
MHTRFVVLEVHRSTKDDTRGLTFRVQARNINLRRILFEMEFDMIPSFVHRGEVVEPHFVWLSSVPETEDALRRCRNLGKGG